jgi:CRP/FNR family transcriptional regulator, cyclic AMP receptor protein
MSARQGLHRDPLAWDARLAMAIGFLDSLDPEDAAELMASGHRRAYGAGVTVVHEGDESGPVLMLLSGRVKVTRGGGAGKEVIVALRGPGDVLGELAAIDGEPRTASVTTLEPVEAVLVPGSAFTAFLERRPRVALALLRLVAVRLREGVDRTADHAMHDVVGRVASRLAELAERFGVERDGRIEIELPLSQEELATWTGASREAVSKALHVLRTLRLVETGRRRLAVLDLEGLRRRAQ